MNWDSQVLERKESRNKKYFCINLLGLTNAINSTLEEIYFLTGKLFEDA
jgi:50S ribosomal subunit-associated GTPase HflX